jgi:hypothetical protein
MEVTTVDQMVDQMGKMMADRSEIQKECKKADQ